MSLYDEYKDVRTAQDLIDMHYRPKKSSELLEVIANLRLEAVRDSILAQVDESMFGAWIPAFVPVISKEEKPVSSIDDIVVHAKVGAKVQGYAYSVFGNPQECMGRIRIVSPDYFGIEWEQDVRDGSDLNGKAHNGRGELVFHRDFHNRNISLFVKGLVDHYELAPNVVADKQLGHKVMFRQQYEGTISDADGRRLQGKLPAGLSATLVDYDESSGLAHIAFDNLIEGFGQRKNFIISTGSAAGSLVVSSLGQVEPKNLEQEVYKQSMLDFFPYAVLDTKTARNVFIAMLMEKDMLFHGPPGSGKTETARDIVHIGRQREVIFVVEGCKVQCNPFSLLDEQFAKKVQPCPECQIKYDKNKDDPSLNFKNTGRYVPPKPSQIRVIPAKFGDGKGVELLEGTVALQRMDLVGYKMPRLDGSLDELGNQFDPEGFSPGVLSRTNNGMLHIDELEKMRPSTMDSFLTALQNDRIKPDQLRFLFPASSVIVGTANDVTPLPDAMNDRMVLIRVGYPEDRDDSYEITKRAFYRERKEASSISIQDPHLADQSILRAIPSPAIIERAVDAFYILFRNEYKGEGAQPILGSNRSKLDALAAARAELVVDQKFFRGTPEIVTDEYAVKGITYAMLSRLQQKTEPEFNEAENQISRYIAEKFPGVMQEEINTWWCRAFQAIAVKETQVPGIEANFRAEIASLRSGEDAYDMFCKLRETQNPGRLPFEHPFISYLAEEQPLGGPISRQQFAALLDYFMKVQETASCS